MNENKTAIEHVDKWLRGKMKGEEVRGLRYEALLDCLQQVEFRAEEEARALESSQSVKDKGLVEMLYKKLYPYPCGESNNRVRLDGSSLDIWFTKDEVDLIISRHEKGAK